MRTTLCQFNRDIWSNYSRIIINSIAIPHRISLAFFNYILTNCHAVIDFNLRQSTRHTILELRK
jgi:hypothetical protein